MLCERCGKNTANVYISQTVNGHKTEMHVCKTCASQLGYTAMPKTMGMDFFNILSPVSSAPVKGACPGCGETYEQYKATRLFGCDKCYTHFSALAEPILKKVHGATEHTGKLPGKADAKLKTKREIDSLRRTLREAVLNEEYEKAAELRDKIKQLEGGDTNDLV
ncbi:MAG: UvrB/UvrC motif-containing protein [Clostridia bacterium]|nr:UvrB/UvrC motif-containing protein [Clostridia bacterium]